MVVIVSSVGVDSISGDPELLLGESSSKVEIGKVISSPKVIRVI